MSKILITGGTGSLGKEIIRQILAKDVFEKIVVFSRDEQKQYHMEKDFPEGGEKGIRYFIGDIRDEPRLISALDGCDTVIHAAAMKHVDKCEYNPDEAIKTNVSGTINVARACHKSGVKKAMFISTDKAVNPINLYGACKKVAEKYWIAANNMGACRFSVCRYGNVHGSNGSVVNLWKSLVVDGKPIPITDKRMTRFWITVQEAAAFVIGNLLFMKGGEIYVPKLPSKSMLQIAEEIVSEPTLFETGIRPGEKLHEKLLDESEIRRCYDYENGYIVYPEFHDWTKTIEPKGVKVHEGFQYESGN